jgi:hypothetical protein
MNSFRIVTPALPEDFKGRRDRSLSCVRLPEVPELRRTHIRWYGRLRASAEGRAPYRLDPLSHSKQCMWAVIGGNARGCAPPCLFAFARHLSSRNRAANDAPRDLLDARREGREAAMLRRRRGSCVQPR